MANLDCLEVMFQNINATGASSVIPRGTRNETPIDVGEDDVEEKTPVAKEKKGGKRSAIDVDPPQDQKKKARNPIDVDPPQDQKKKARNPMVRQVTKLVKVISTGKSKNALKTKEEIIALMEDVVQAEASEGSDEHLIASKLFVKLEYRAVWFSLKTNEGKMAWLKRMYDDRKKN
uniref:Uncharacterized protein n=1 Tax=Arundo donax TaxID=35708 RepID=A0A0A9A154_ARUDO